MTHLRAQRFTVHTTSGRGAYRSRTRAIAAARWVADEKGEAVTVSNEKTGQRWDIAPVYSPASEL